jgi:N-acetylglucosamine kinase-like BadF-type ATPase
MITLGCSDRGSHRAAGWGPEFRDAGCGHDIGQRGLAAAAASIDGRGPRSTLEVALPRACGVDSMLLAMQWAYKEPRSWSRIASLAPAVIQCAVDGDAVAHQLLQDCSAELVKSVTAVWSRVAVADSQPLPLALSGGLLHDDKNAIYRDMVTQQLQLVLPAHDVLWYVSHSFFLGEMLCHHEHASL